MMKVMMKVMLMILCLAVSFSITAQEKKKGDQLTSESAGDVKPTHESSSKIRQKTFKVVWEKVNKTHFDPTFNGVDWNKARERYAPLAAAAKTDAELYKVLNKMLAELRSSHFGVVPSEAVEGHQSASGYLGLMLSNIDDLAVITRVEPDSPAGRAGLRAGFVITKIDDTAVKEIDDLSDALSGLPQTSVRLTYLDKQDNPHEVKLERQLWRGDVFKISGITLSSEFEARRLADNIGYIRFTQFIPSLNNKISAAVRSMSDAPGIIIDLRGNTGGDDSVAVKMSGMFFAKPTQLMVTKTRSGDDNYYKAKPQKNPFLCPVVILVDEVSGSASEQFAAGMQEVGRATVIGKQTAGSVLDANLMKLPTGALLLYAYGEPRTPKGKIIEGRGVIPDIKVSLTRAGLLNGDDSQLGAAIKYIQDNSAKQASSGTAPLCASSARHQM